MEFDVSGPNIEKEKSMTDESDKKKKRTKDKKNDDQIGQNEDNIRSSKSKKRKKHESAPTPVMGFEAQQNQHQPKRPKHADVILIYSPKIGTKGRRSIIEAFNRQYRAAFERRLKLVGLEVETELSQTIKPQVWFIKVYATTEYLMRTAEMLETKVAVSRNDLVHQPTCCGKIFNRINNCLERKYKTEPPQIIENNFRITYKRELAEYLMYKDEPEKLLSSAQRSKLVEFEIEQIKIPMHAQDHRSGTLSDNREDGEIISRAINFQWLHHHRIYTGIFKNHDSDGTSKRKNPNSMRRWLRVNWASFFRFNSPQPLDQIREYFGSELAFYFAWLGFYTRMLTIPTVLGLIALCYGIHQAVFGAIVNAVCSSESDNITVCRKCPSLTCKYHILSDACMATRLGQLFDNRLALTFSLLLSIWAVTFLELWKRRQCSLSAKWNTIGKASKEDIIRPEYLHGVKRKRISPVTMKEEPYIPKSEKCRRVMLSVMIASTFVIILIANIIGLIVYRTVSENVYENLHDPFIDSIGVKLFTSYTASFLNLVFISIMSYIYPKIAWKLTQQEYPRTQQDFDRSYTYKVILFQFFNYYGTIFYLAFYVGKDVRPPQYLNIFTKQCGPQGCMYAVTVQLLVVSTMKQMFQNCTELAVPILKIFFRRFKHRKVAKLFGKLSQCEKDYFLNDMPQPMAFNDFQEMIIQYGFLTMFAPAFPLGAFFALLNNIIEIRLDAYKYVTKYRRPVPRDSLSIGAWMDVLENITRFSVLVNAGLIAFTSNCIDLILYQIKFSKDFGILQFAFSRFNTSDYSDRPESYASTSQFTVEQLRHDEIRNVTVETCAYQGMFYPYDASPDLRYTHREEYMIEALGKLGVIIVFENLVLFIQGLIRHYVPPLSVSLKNRLRREGHIQRQLLMKHELAKNQQLLESASRKPSAYSYEAPLLEIVKNQHPRRYSEAVKLAENESIDQIDLERHHHDLKETTTDVITPKRRRKKKQKQSSQKLVDTRKKEKSLFLARVVRRLFGRCT